ncbi:cadherin-like beta sandwich domain-containing protein [Mucilaginibacter xinganensis]|uniref:Serine/threonine-protein kinase PknD n=1 Tax=Mucilaginibacter xinganensis TaxID=1234841 RepID=A0A223P2A0_9SPHI|nr:cadherin-like beta sandwich domain-containing protein [Mucilaginibacter xinganensis]ASU36279.1 Serine/threonine-protein kinase PknD [Mucilaginibacter xinganensis]
MNTRLVNRKAASKIKSNQFTGPYISYTSPQTYVAGTAITPLAPVISGGVAASPAYSSSTTTLGSGFNIPAGIAVDGAGNIYIGDQNNNVVKKIPGGTGTPVVIGTGFNTPDGVAVDAAGNVYVADDGNNLVKKIPVGGGPIITLGSGFLQPFNVAVDGAGNVYVADRGNNAVKEIPVGGGAVITLGSGFVTPTGVAVDAYGNVYVADFGNSAIKKIPVGGGAPVTLGSGFSTPFGVAVDGSGNVFVTDYGNKQVKEIPVSGGPILTVGSGYSFLFGVAVDGSNNVFVTDYGNNAVKEINPVGGYYISPALPAGLSFNNTTGIISGTPAAASPATNYTVTVYNNSGSNTATLNLKVNAVSISYTSPQTYVAGTAITPLAPVISGGVAASPAYSSSTTTLGSGFNIPAGIAVDGAGNIYIGDQNNNVVKKIPGGTGTPVVIGTGFNTPDGVAVDAAGNVYVADDGNNLVKKIPVGGGPIITLGSGFLQPFNVAVDGAGNVYVADRGNNAVKEIPVGGGAVITLGSGFVTPTGVAVDAYGNVYVADFGNSAIKKIPVGGGAPVTLGSGFSTPFGVAVDGSGNVFVTDYGNKQVKEIPVSGGPILTVGSGYSFLFGVAVDGSNNVFVTDYGNNAVKEINPVGGYYISPALPAGLSFNNTTGIISGTPAAASPATNYTVTVYNNSGSNTATLNLKVNAVSISYTSPQTYVAGTAITPLAPVISGGVAASPAYSSSTTTLGSGFNIPAGIAVDGAGNIYIGDQNNNVVKKIPGGTGTPVVIGTGFNTPDGVAVDAAGNVYVADDGNNLVKKIPVGGGPIITLGSGFLQPFNVAVDGAGNVYVADRGNNAVKEIPVGGGAVITLGSGFVTPTGVAVDAYGNVYVADFGNSAIKKIPVGGGAPVTLGSGFSTPFGVAVDGSGNVFVTDYGNKQVKEIPVSGGPILTVGSGYSFLFGVAVDGSNNVFVTDYGNNAVKEINPVGGYYISPALPAGLSFNNTTGIISGTPAAASPATNYTVTVYNNSGSNTATLNLKVNAVSISYTSPQTYVAGTAITPLAPVISGGVAASPAYSSSTTTLGSGFNIPAGIAVDGAGNIYIGDQNNNVVKKIPGGTGTPVVIGTGFNTPDGVAVDAAGNVYVADDGNNLVKKIPVGGGPIITLGSGFLQPFNVAVDGAGNVYVADRGNNAVKEIPVGGGAVITLGSGFVTPTGVAVDAYGNVYVADFGNSAIKKIPVGGGAPVTLGSGFSTPFGVAVDGSGNVFVTDYGNKQVKEIPVSGGPILTVGSGYSFLFGVAVDGSNNVFVTDYGNNAVKEINPVGGYYISPALPAGLSFNNTTGIISGTPAAASPATNYTVTVYNNSGSNTATLNLKVNAVSISYTSPQTYVAGTAITPLAPVISGGVAASPAYSSSTTTLGSGFNIPAGIAVDGAGNIYIGDQNNNVVKKIPGGTGTPVVIGTGFNTPDGVAVDAAGNVYVADDGNNLVKKIPVGGGPIITLGSGFLQPFNVAVDGAGNVYVADRGNNAVKEIPVGGGAVITLGSGFVTPTGVAVDAYGNVYVADFGNSAIKKIPVGGGAPVTLGSGFSTPFGVAVDGSGNVFVTDYGNKQVKEIPVSGGPILTVGSGYSFLFGVAVDGSNNVFVTDYGNNAVKEINPVGGYYISPALPAGLSFNNTTGIISGTPAAASPATNYTVTVYNNSGSNTATLNLKVITGASNTYLTNLAISKGVLSPTFAAGTISYTAIVPNAFSSITLTPTAGDPDATIKVNGAAVVSGTASANLPLVAGKNIISTVVKSSNGAAAKTYTLTMTRAAAGLSTNALLTSIKVTPATPLVTVVGSGYKNYFTSVPNSQTSLQVTSVVQDANATIKVNGTLVASGAPSAAIPLVAGSNVITVIVTAPDSATTKSFIITATRAPASNATLANLKPSKGILSPVFAPGTNAYTTIVPNATTSITVTPTPGDPDATVRVNGVIVAPGAASASQPLVEGTNVINILVTASDAITTQSYTLTVTRAAAGLSTNALLTSLKFSPASTFVTVSGPDYKDYTSAVPNSETSLQVIAVAADANAVIKVNGITVASGVASQVIPLVVGSNIISVVVTAQDNATVKSFVTTVNRAASSNANLANLTISSGTLSPAFASAVTSYTASVANAVSSIKITPTTSDAGATVTVNGTAVASGAASASLPLAIGTNTITTVVTAADASTKTYTLTVTRISNNALLTSLKFSPASAFVTVSGPDYRDYTSAVPNSETSLQVIAVASDANATIKVNGTIVASGVASQVIPLAVGSNVVSVVVTAQDGVTNKSFITTVTRAAASMASQYTETPADSLKTTDESLVVRPAISPNGDGINDVLIISNIEKYPDNKLTIINAAGAEIYQATGYDNINKVFDGHSNKTMALQKPGTYFYQLEYNDKGRAKYKTGYILLKY